MKVLFLLNSFPSISAPSDGIFNLRAYKQISNYCELKIIVVKAWSPKKKIRHYLYEGINVSIIYLPYLPYNYRNISFFKNLYLHNLSIKIALFFSKKYLSKYLSNINLIHSVDLNLNMLIGNTISKKYKIPHISQAIGSDVNDYLPLISTISAYKSWNNPLRSVICNSRNLELRLNEMTKGKIKTHVVYRGVNTDVYTFKLSNNSDIQRNLRFLFIGGCVGEGPNKIGNLKGAFNLLQAWFHLEKIYNKEFGELYFGGPNSSSPEVKRFINNFKNPKSVKIIGFLEPNDLVNIYKEVDVLIIPSESEGLPNVLLEAMASGCIVIANDIGGISEVLIDNFNGFLNKDCSINGLVTKVKGIINNFQNMNEIRINAYNTIQSSFDSRLYGKSIYDIYLMELRNIFE